MSTREETLSKIGGFFLPIVMGGLFFGFVSLVPYIQTLPLFRLDTTDACWFAMCLVIYLIPGAPVLMLAGLVLLGGIAGVVRVLMLFYEHVILRPGRIILILWIGIVLGWLGWILFEG